MFSGLISSTVSPMVNLRVQFVCNLRHVSVSITVTNFAKQ